MIWTLLGSLLPLAYHEWFWCRFTNSAKFDVRRSMHAARWTDSSLLDVSHYYLASDLSGKDAGTFSLTTFRRKLVPNLLRFSTFQAGLRSDFLRFLVGIVTDLPSSRSRVLLFTFLPAWMRKDQRLKNIQGVQDGRGGRFLC
jgi:hypothetical protein